MLPKADRTYSSRKERLAVEAFYQKRNYAPVWFERGALSARTNAAIARIHASAADGLIPAEYKIPDMTPPRLTRRRTPSCGSPQR